MAEIKQLIKQAWKLHNQMRWLKKISKEADKYHELDKKLSRQAAVVNALVKVYKEKFGEDLRR